MAVKALVEAGNIRKGKKMRYAIITGLYGLKAQNIKKGEKNALLRIAKKIVKANKMKVYRMINNSI